VAKTFVPFVPVCAVIRDPLGGQWNVLPVDTHGINQSAKGAQKGERHEKRDIKNPGSAKFPMH
jgi:hypothetical protein